MLVGVTKVFVDHSFTWASLGDCTKFAKCTKKSQWKVMVRSYVHDIIFLGLPVIASPRPVGSWWANHTGKQTENKRTPMYRPCSCDLELDDQVKMRSPLPASSPSFRMAATSTFSQHIVNYTESAYYFFTPSVTQDSVHLCLLLGRALRWSKSGTI